MLRKYKKKNLKEGINFIKKNIYIFLNFLKITFKKNFKKYEPNHPIYFLKHDT